MRHNELCLLRPAWVKEEFHAKDCTVLRPNVLVLGSALGISAGGVVSAANIAASKGAADAMRADVGRQHPALEMRMDAALDRMDRLGELYQAKCD